MYIAFEKDPNRDGKRAIIVFVLCLVFFALAFKCSGQTCYTRSKPYTDNQKITRILSCYGLQYEANDKNVFISIFADSINPHDYTISIYVVFDTKKLIKSPKLVMNFVDNESQECMPYYFDKSTGYVEFNMKVNNFNKLRNYKVDYVDFINDDISYPMAESNISLFYDFMRGL